MREYEPELFKIKAHAATIDIGNFFQLILELLEECKSIVKLK